MEWGDYLHLLHVAQKEGYRSPSPTDTSMLYSMEAVEPLAAVGDWLSQHSIKLLREEREGPAVLPSCCNPAPCLVWHRRKVSKPMPLSNNFWEVRNEVNCLVCQAMLQFRAPVKSESGFFSFNSANLLKWLIVALHFNWPFCCLFIGALGNEGLSDGYYFGYLQYMNQKLI